MRRAGRAGGHAQGKAVAAVALALALALATPAAALPQDWPISWPQTFNWSDSPVLLDLHQYGGFNDNILNSPPGVQPKASALSQTGVGATARLRLGQQAFTASASLTATDYLDDPSASLHDRALRLGWDQRLGEPCKGRLATEASDKQSDFDQASGPGQDILRTRKLDDEGRCAVSGPFGALVGGGASSLRHSTLSAQALDNDKAYGKLGLDYEGRNRDHAEIFIKLTGLRFPQATGTLSPDSTLTDLQASYRRAFSPLWEARAMIGASAAPTTPGAAPNQIAVYDAELLWTPSELWRASFSASRTLNAPISILANSQIAQTLNFSLTWRPTPKLSFTAGLGRLRLENGPTTPGLYGGTTLNTVSGRAVYQMTPFTSLTASFLRGIRSVAAGQTQTTLAMIGVDFKPY